MSPASKTEKRYSKGEEIANAVTHGIGWGLSIAALALLATYAGRYGDAWHVVSGIIYGSTLVLLYAASTLYHALTNPQAKRVFQVLDHMGIFLLIAGTYTPVTLVSLRGGWGWSLFGVVWGLAIVGIFVEVIWGTALKKLSIALYLGMGWIALVAIVPLLSALSRMGWVWFFSGGLAYTVGVIFYKSKKIPFNHAIWHLFVLGGSICHFFAVFFHVLPSR